jgi:hypothetical protein
VFNVIYTITGQNFADWIKEKVKERNELKAQKEDLMIEMDPELYRAFCQSTQISSKYFELSPLHTILTLFLSFRCSWERKSNAQSWLEKKKKQSRDG